LLHCMQRRSAGRIACNKSVERQEQWCRQQSS
jgi:hypothetical protein